MRALMRGDYFVTSGEVLIPSYAIRGSGDKRTIEADVEWTFPLDFVEVTWGDGVKTGSTIVTATDLPPMGRHHFSIPFDAAARSGCALPRGTRPATARWCTSSAGAPALRRSASTPCGTVPRPPVADVRCCS